MVQIIENWARINGTVLDVRPDLDVADHVMATVRVASSEPVERAEGGAYPDLLGVSAGDTIELHVPRRLAVDHALEPGRNLIARVTKATPSRVFVHPEDVVVR